MPQVDAHLQLWRAQLELITRQAQDQCGRLEADAAAPDTSPLACQRLRALARAVGDQLADVTAAYAPLSAAVAGRDPLELPSHAQSPLNYIHYLYRDWAWEQAGSMETADSLAALRDVATPASLGRTLVFGAAGCRLAYDLMGDLAAEEVVALDIDPFTFTVAEAVVRGQTVRLTEANLAVQEVGNVARVWNLTAPGGPRPRERFHLVLGNGLAPPFAAATFDTVVTPWFIDQVPQDVGQFFTLLARLLRPGGRWINQGPLLYRVDVPLSRRHTREELFELASAAGFAITKWSASSRPYLVSPLNGRGRTEWVLTFEAVRTR